MSWTRAAALVGVVAGALQGCGGCQCPAPPSTDTGPASDAAAPIPCAGDEDCPVEAPVCAAGACTGIECDGPEDCAEGETCFLTLCTERECETGGECQPPLECIDGVCFPPFTVDWVARGHDICGTWGDFPDYAMMEEGVAWSELASELVNLNGNCKFQAESRWRLEVRPYHDEGLAFDYPMGLYLPAVYAGGNRIVSFGELVTLEECENAALPPEYRKYLFDLDLSAPTLGLLCDLCDFPGDSDISGRKAPFVAPPTVVIFDYIQEDAPIYYYDVSTYPVVELGSIDPLLDETFRRAHAAPGKVCWEVNPRVVGPEAGRFRILDIASGETTVFPGLHPDYEHLVACDEDGFYTKYSYAVPPPPPPLELREYDHEGTFLRAHAPEGQEAWMVYSEWRNVGSRFWTWLYSWEAYALERSVGVPFRLPGYCPSTVGDHIAWSSSGTSAPPWNYLFVLHIE